MKRMIAVLFAVCLTLPTAALAHDASKHKGKPVHGEVLSVTTDNIELKTTPGTMPVTFSSKTKFEHGNAVVDKTHVTKGAHIAVFGTKLPTGELVAREVLIGAGEQKEANATAKKATPTPAKGKAAPAHGEHKH